MTGYVYPNEVELWWSVLITLYPYITGLVAGAFVISSLYHVFGVEALKPVSRLALLAALATLIVAPMPLLLHLGQPLNALNIMWTPHLTSAMAGFGYIYSFYLIVVLLEIWFVYRQDMVNYAQNSTSGVARLFYRIITLGSYDVSDYSLKMDHKIYSILAMIGIPSAAFLHGYVGFIFGAIKANPWWSTPLMPVIFLMSAIVSGTAFLIIVYTLSCRLRRVKVQMPCLMTMNKYLWFFLTFDIVLELLEVLHKGYEGREDWHSISGLLTQQIPFSFIGVQLILGAAIPFILLLIARTSKRLPLLISQSFTIGSAVLIMIGVYAMRFNVIIGGQMISKSNMGFSAFHAKFFGLEGIGVAVLLIILAFTILAVLTRILPPWLEKDSTDNVQKNLSGQKFSIETPLKKSSIG